MAYITIIDDEEKACNNSKTAKLLMKLHAMEKGRRAVRIDSKTIVLARPGETDAEVRERYRR